MVGFGSLWIIGLAVLLTAIGFADHEAHIQASRTGNMLRQPGYKLAVSAGLTLFFIGLLGSAEAWWEWAVWTLLALFSAYSTWRSWRQVRGRQWEEQMESVAGVGEKRSPGTIVAEGGSPGDGSRPPRVNILGVRVSAISLADAVETILEWIARGSREYVCLAPVHAVMECYRSVELTRIYNESGLTTPDGMPIVWLLKSKGYTRVSRVYGPDLMLALMRRSSKAGYRHYFYGGTPEVLDQLVSNLRGQSPEMEVAGCHAPPFRSLEQEEERAIVDAINAAQPDILWVALGSPKQERWMSAHRDRLHAPVMIGVGAAFDFISGAKPQAPSWMQRSGLEWLFRLASEPRRLWRRYLIDNPTFVALMLAQYFGWRRFRRVA